MKPFAGFAHIVALIAVALACATPARADGTLGLGDVLAAVRTAPRLVAEVTDALDKNGLAAANVTCLGARHGRHWVHLGGMRAAPYRCKIGNRELTIEADRIYVDARGRNIADRDPMAPRNATAFRERHIRWEWVGTGR